MTAENNDSLIKLAIKAYNAKDYSRSIEICQKIRLYDKSYVRAYHGLAKSFAKLKDFYMSCYFYNLAISIASEQSDKEILFKLYKEKGSIDCILNEFEDAISDYEEALKIKPGNKEIEEAIKVITNILNPEIDEKNKEGDMFFDLFESGREYAEAEREEEKKEFEENYDEFFEDWETYTNTYN